MMGFDVKKEARTNLTSSEDQAEEYRSACRQMSRTVAARFNSHSHPMSDEAESVFGAAFDEATAAEAVASSAYRPRGGIAPPAVESRGPAGFVGLSNQGATCYLNAALQSLFMCPDFRARILSIPPAELHVDSYEAEQLEALQAAEREAAAQAAGLPVKKALPPLDVEAVDELVSFGFPENMVRKALRKYPLAGQKEAAVTALMDGEISDTEVVEELDDVVRTLNRPKPRRIPIELQRLFARLQGLDTKSISTQALTESFGWGVGAVAIQQDVYELTVQLMDALERSLKSTSQESMVSDLFKFNVVNRIRCNECHGISSRTETYLGMPITVQDCTTLHQALAKACAVEHFTGSSLYRCSMGCDGRRTEAARSTAFATLPPVLMLNLNRFTWNQQGERHKLSHACAFPLTLDMRPYLEGQLPIERIAGGAMQPACPEYRTSSLVHELPEKARKNKEHTALQEPCELDETSTELYDLIAVLIHAGTPYGGHYTAKILDVANTRHWFAFNDSIVNPIEVQQLASQYGGKGNPETAYMLFYRRRDLPLPAVPALSSSLQSLLQAENALLAEQRLAYEVYLNTIDVQLYPEQCLRLCGTDLQFCGANSDDTLMFANVRIDQRSSLSDLIAETHKQFAARMCALSDADNVSAACRFSSEGRSLARLDLTSTDRVALYTIRGFDTNELDRRMVDAGISSGERLLCFDGATVCGIPAPLEVKKGTRLVISCLYLTQPADSTSHHTQSLVFIGSKAESTVTDLVQFLRQTLHIDILSCLTHVFKADQIEPFSFQSTGLLKDLGLNDGITIAIEHGTSDTESGTSIAAMEFRAQRSVIRLIIVHACQTACEFELTVRTGLTLAALKAEVITRLPDACRSQHLRLRRRLGRSKEGSLYTDESQTLQSVGLDQDDLGVQIEHGELPGDHEAEVLISVQFPTDSQRRDIRMLLDVRRSIKETKDLILTNAGFVGKASNYCLHRVDATWGGRGKLFNNESLPLNKLGITTGDHLWLEVGTIPSKGLVNLDCYLYVPHANNSSAFCRQKLLETFASLAPADVAQTVTSLCRSTNATLISNPIEPQDGNITGLKLAFSLQVQSNDSLEDFRLLVHSQPKIEALADEPSNLRIRLFRGHSPGKLVPCALRALSKQGITSDRSIVVQPIADAALEAVLSPHASLLQVYRALPHPNSHGTMLFSMFPVEVLWDGGETRADLESLTESVTSGLNDDCIPRRYLLAKWIHSQRRWQPLRNESTQAELEKSNAVSDQIAPDAISDVPVIAIDQKAPESAQSSNENPLSAQPTADVSANEGNGVDISGLTDDELAELLASGFDLGMTESPAQVASATATHKSQSKPKQQPSKIPAKFTAKSKSKQKPKHRADSKQSEKHAELLGIRGKPYLIRDGDVLVAIDMSDVALISPSSCDECTLLERIAEWGPPPGAAGKSEDGETDLQRAMGESLSAFAKSQRGAEVGVSIQVDF